MGPEPGQSVNPDAKPSTSGSFPTLTEKWADIQTSESDAAQTPRSVPVQSQGQSKGKSKAQPKLQSKEQPDVAIEEPGWSVLLTDHTDRTFILRHPVKRLAL